jgi:hypothetical protein
MALSNSRFAHDHIVYSHFPGRWRKAAFGVCAGFLRGFDNSGVLAISNVPYWSRLMESFFNEALEKDSRGYKTMRPNACAIIFAGSFERGVGIPQERWHQALENNLKHHRSSFRSLILKKGTEDTKLSVY